VGVVRQKTRQTKQTTPKKQQKHTQKPTRKTNTQKHAQKKRHRNNTKRTNAKTKKNSKRKRQITKKQKNHNKENKTQTQQKKKRSDTNTTKHNDKNSRRPTSGARNRGPARFTGSASHCSSVLEAMVYGRGQLELGGHQHRLQCLSSERGWRGRIGCTPSHGADIVTGAGKDIGGSER